MAIIWSGLGFVVFVLVVVAIPVAQVLASMGGSQSQRFLMWPIWGITAGLANYAFARWLGVLEETKGHRFLFVPVRYWTFLLPLFGMVGLIEVLTGRR